MQELLQQDLIPALWIAFAVYWTLAAVHQSRVKENESQNDLWFYCAVGASAFLLLFYVRDRIAALLVVLGLFYGLLAVVGSKQTKRRESLFSRLPHVAAMIAAFVLLFGRPLRLGPLSYRFLPNSQTTAWAGALLTACGVAVAIWARVCLGANWSANVKIRANHTLVRTGPYARLRHPVYSGVLLAISGTALAEEEWRGLLALAAALTAFSIKAKREEAFLRGEFGSEFVEHARYAGFFLPRLVRHGTDR
jgi:protein-S-isoprenylcysteine O-methyltransferase Ste14